MKYIMCSVALSSAFVVVLAYTDELWKEMPYHYTAERQHDNREKSHADINLSAFTIYILYFHIEKIQPIIDIKSDQFWKASSWFSLFRQATCYGVQWTDLHWHLVENNMIWPPALSVFVLYSSKLTSYHEIKFQTYKFQEDTEIYVYEK